MTARINNNSIPTDPLCIITQFLDDKDWALTCRVCRSWNASIQARPNFINERLQKVNFKIISDVFGGRKNFCEIPAIPLPRPIAENGEVVVYSPPMSDQLIQRFRLMECPVARAIHNHSLYILIRLKNRRNPDAIQRIQMWQIQRVAGIHNMPEAIFHRYREISFVFERYGGILSLPSWHTFLLEDSDRLPRNYDISVDYLKRIIRKEPCGTLGCINEFAQGGEESERTTRVRGAELSTVSLISRPTRSWRATLIVFAPQIALLVLGFATAYLAARMQSKH